MPIYALKCNHCGNRFETFAKMSTKFSTIKCPLCKGKGAKTDWETVTFGDGNRRFSGTEEISVAQGFRPSEVRFARRHITAGKIHDDGKVSFKDRQDERNFRKQLEILEHRIGLDGPAPKKHGA